MGSHVPLWSSPRCTADLTVSQVLRFKKVLCSLAVLIGPPFLVLPEGENTNAWPHRWPGRRRPGTGRLVQRAVHHVWVDWATGEADDGGWGGKGQEIGQHQIVGCHFPLT